MPKTGGKSGVEERGTDEASEKGVYSAAVTSAAAEGTSKVAHVAIKASLLAALIGCLVSAMMAITIIVSTRSGSSSRG